MWWVMLSVAAMASASTDMRCEDAHLKCAYRVGCGRALQNYASACMEILQYGANRCPESCVHALIALTSTEEGKNLMNCKCSDPKCEEQIRRVEVCRPQVMATVSQEVLPCRVAQWICAADAYCTTALEYFHQYCKSMFHGKKCTLRCNNSISILRRQEKAAKLFTCRCDGMEDFDCLAMQKNMDRLCFHKHRHSHVNTTTSSHHPPKVEDPPTVVVIDDDSGGVSLTVSYFSMFAVTLCWLLT